MPSILVVEPEERYAERIRGALTSEGWRVRVVPQADQAIQAAASEAPDLVVVSAEVPGAYSLAGTFSRGAGGPGVVGLVPEGRGAAGLGADDLVPKPFSDDELRAAARRALAARRPSVSAGPPPAPGPDQKLTSLDIFGDVLAEVEGEEAPPPRPAAPPPQATPQAAAPASAPAPSAPAAGGDDEMQRRLEKTLSGVLGAEPRPRPSAPPAAPPAPAAAAPPKRTESASGDVDALLSRTLSNLGDLGRTKTGVRPADPAAAPRPAAPAPPAAPPPAAAAPPRPPSPAAPAAAAPVGEGTGVRKPRMVGDFDFSELEELARSGVRAPAPPRPAPAPTPTPAPAPPPAAARPAPPPPAPPVSPLPPMSSMAPMPPLDLPDPDPLPFQAPTGASVRHDAAATQRIPVFTDDGGEGERFGQYTLLERIAVGGMAEVWKARMRGVEGFQKTVAIKRILPHMTDNAEFVGMFIDEAKLAAQLSHPNIVHIYDLGKIGRDYYIAMEYVDGKDLRSLLNAARRAGRPLPLGLSLMVAARVASALDYAHRKRDFDDREIGLVHRDVSPQNVLLTYEGDVKLCDFGIAKAVSKVGQTQMGALKGKLQYMSPEQAWGRPVDARSDLFSLGAVLFEMVTGERQFPGDSEISVLESVRQGRVRAPRQVDPSVPREIDEIVVRALAVDPKDRFQSAGEMKQRLEAVLAALSPQPGPTDLAAYIRGVLDPSAAPPAVAPAGPAILPEAVAAPPAAVPPAPPSIAAPPPVAVTPPPSFEAAVPSDVVAPLDPVAPVGDLVAEEEGGRKSRTLLYAAIAALIVVAVLTFFFLNRRRAEAPPAATTPSTSAQPPAAVPAPAANAIGQAPVQTAPAATPGVDVQAIVDQQLARQEEALRAKQEKDVKELEKQLAAAKAAGKPLPSGAASATPAAAVPSPAPAPVQAAPAPEPSPSSPPPPAPEPEPQREPEPKAPAPEPTKPKAPEAPRVRVGDLAEPGPGAVPPQLVSFPKAEYPPAARNLRVQGVVVVSVLVDENGKVQETRMEEPIKQNVGINEAALRAARSASYRPATKDGVRVRMWTRLRIPFKLDS